MAPRTGFGFTPSPHDDRDRPLVGALGAAGALFGAVPGELPAEHYTLIAHLDEVLDQKSTESCVLHAIRQQHWLAQHVQGAKKVGKLSVLFGYWAARQRLGREHLDTGCQPREAWKALAALGFPKDSLWPFAENRVNLKPDFDAFSGAVDQKWLSGYYAVTGHESREQEIKTALSRNHAVVLGTVVDPAFTKYQSRGIQDVLGPPRGFAGRHMMCAVGYDIWGLWLVNSWGEGDWGCPDPLGRFRGGFCRMSWEWLNSYHVTDIWVATAAKEFA